MSDLKKRQSAMEEILTAALREWETSGEFAKLQGRPVDLSDPSPEWFGTRLLKSEGATHPLIQKSRDIDQLRAEADALAERFRDAPPRSSSRRNDLVHEYRESLEKLNREILTFNLMAPPSMHKPLLRVNQELTQMES